jgi:hypothetical protein
VAVIVGPAETGVNAILVGPAGTASGARHQRVVGGSDLYPAATLKWKQGSNNYMLYTMEGVPTGSYSVQNITNIGLNHWSTGAVQPIPTSTRQMNSPPRWVLPQL